MAQVPVGSGKTTLNRRWFTAALAARDLSQRQLAKRMGVDPASIHRLLTGKRPMRMSEAADIARLLCVPVADVLEHAGLDVAGSGRTVPLVGFVDGTGTAHVDWTAVAETVQAPADLPGRAVAVQLRTAGTGLDQMDGWTLFVAPPDDGVGSEAPGRLCLAGLPGDGVLLRFVRRGYTRGTYNLAHPGLDDRPNAKLEWAVPVLHIRP